jgi:hypothetical protein
MSLAGAGDGRAMKPSAPYSFTPTCQNKNE